MHYRHGAPRQGLVMGYAASDAALTQKGILSLRESFEACRDERRALQL